MDSSSFPSLTRVRSTHPGELAVLLSTVTADAVSAMDAAGAEAVVVATQRVNNWAAGLQAVAVDRFAEHVLDAQEHHAADLVAARDQQRAQVEAGGGTWRGDTGAVALPEPEQVAASMLAPELRISPRTMRTRLNRARALMELPTTLALALGGELEPWRVDAVVVASRDVAADRLLELETRLYDADATALPRPRLVERVRRAAVKADPDSVTRGIARAPRRRSLRVAPSETAGLMTWTLQVPDDLSRRLFAAVDALAQEYLTADQRRTPRHTTEPAGAGWEPAGPGATDAGPGATAAATAPPLREKRTVEAARLDALGDLVMANADITTVVELLVPVDAGTRTLTTRPTPREAVTTALATPSRPGPVDAVLVDLVLGSVTTDTLAAGPVERHLGLVLGGHLETDTNPFLTHQPAPPGHTSPPGTRPPTGPSRPNRAPVAGTALGAPPPPPSCTPPQAIWFVDGLVEAPGATALLPEQVTALLADPDTLVRINSAAIGTADAGPARRQTYRPGRALAARVRARDRHCRFPGCSVPAKRCHLDHVTAFPHGDTVEDNLQCLCPAHHGFKHHAGWTVTMTDDGACAWTTPTGTTHMTTPGTTRDVAA
ncbi:MAG TPA: hypothetical protein VFI44_07705 [Ornithinibacter sp.]|nr:hypothetical protein [Ornithinibacter sp.]